MSGSDGLVTYSSGNSSDFTTLTTAVQGNVYRRPFNNDAIIITATLIFPLAVFGMLANLLTFMVIFKSVRLRSIFNHFIMSLCISDFLSSLTSLLFVYRRTWGFEEWTISDFLCKFFWSVDTGTSVSTSLHIIMFSVLRFISISFPHRYNRIRSDQAKVLLLVLWVIAVVGGAIPWGIWTGAVKIDRTVDLPISSWPSCTVMVRWLDEFKAYTVYGYILFYYIPFFLVFVLSVMVSLVLYFKRKNRLRGRGKDFSKTDEAEIKRRRKENQAIVQLFLIVGSFFVGYIPRTGFHIFSLSSKQVTYEDRVLHWWLGVGEYLCLRVSECLNPVFYNLVSSKMREETVRYLRRMCGKKTEGPKASVNAVMSTYT